MTEAITYDNIFVEGAPYIRILDLNITQKVNDHGRASITGEVDSKSGSEYAKRADETYAVAIRTTAENQPGELFYGVIAQAALSQQSGYSVLKLELKSASSLLDMEKKKKSFQNTAKTYEEILNQVVGSKAVLQMNVTDRAIGRLIAQYNETDWEFIRRMASEFEAPVFTNVNTKIPVITIGIPVNGKASELGKAESGARVTASQYVFVGDSVSMGGSGGNVQEVTSTFRKGELVSEVSPVQADTLIQPQITNTQASGKMFTGIVQKVEKDKVQVFITDIDDSYDAGGTVWLPYSTAYSSGDGSGFYCMPAEQDTVRVFFPSDNEGDAFAASSVNVSPLDDPKHKKWRSPAGKEILMTEEGLFITCKEQRIFINLKDAEGISIQSDKDVNIISSSNMLLMAENIQLKAENEILISTASSYIDMQPDKIELGAENVVIN